MGIDSVHCHEKAFFFIQTKEKIKEQKPKPKGKFNKETEADLNQVNVSPPPRPNNCTFDATILDYIFPSEPFAEIGLIVLVQY